MPPLETVQLPALEELELRDFERREIVTRLVPYGERITYRGRPESFAAGSAAHIDPTAIRLLSFHDPNRPIGRGVSIEERADGAHVTFRVSRTREGDEMLELARDGVLGISPGFVPGEQTADGVHTRVAAIPEASLVTFQAYPSAQVLAVRQTGDNNMPPEPQPTGTVVDPASGVGETVPAAPATEPTSPDLEALETRVSELHTGFTRLESRLDAPAAHGGRIVPSSLTPFNWFRASVEALTGRHERRAKMEEDFAALQTRVAEGKIETRDVYDELGIQTRALADVTGGATQAGDNSPADDLSGLVVEEFMADQLFADLDRRRPVFANVGRLRMPRSGYAQIPVVTQHSTVAARAGQKQEANSQKMITTNRPFAAEWLDGAVDVALEIIRTADLDTLQLIWNDLLAAYAKATEVDPTSGIVSKIETNGMGFTYTGAAIDTASYAAFVDDVMTQSEKVEDETNAPATLLFLPRSVFRTVAGFVDANDRRQFAPIGATNADATSGINSKRIALPDGPTLIKASTDDLTAAVLTNPEALKAADGGPERLEALNVANMGRDLGVLGRTMVVPRIPLGVVYFGTEPA